jgi:hypothetical protein
MSPSARVGMIFTSTSVFHLGSLLGISIVVIIYYNKHIIVMYIIIIIAALYFAGGEETPQTVHEPQSVYTAGPIVKRTKARLPLLVLLLTRSCEAPRIDESHDLQ